MLFEETPFSLAPVNFFAIEYDCKYVKKGQYPPVSTHALPSLSHLCDEEAFAKIAMGWNEHGLAFYVEVEGFDRVKSFFPAIEKGDSVELMLDTRDLKSAGFNTRFCHHFYFLPEPVEGRQCGELTRFRTEDSHPLCDPNLLTCKANLGVDGYSMKMFIPSSCLYGYDRNQFDRLGFTYRLNRAGGRSQHFCVLSQEYQIGQQPSLWSSIKLKE